MILGCWGGLWLSSWCHIHDSGLFWGNNSGTFLLQVCIKHNLLSFVVYHRYETIAGWETIQNVYESLSTLRRLNIKISSMFSGKAMTPLLRHLGQDELWTIHKWHIFQVHLSHSSLKCQFPNRCQNLRRKEDYPQKSVFCTSSLGSTGPYWCPPPVNRLRCQSLSLKQLHKPQRLLWLRVSTSSLLPRPAIKRIGWEEIQQWFDPSSRAAMRTSPHPTLPPD